MPDDLLTWLNANWQQDTRRTKFLCGTWNGREMIYWRGGWDE